MKLAAEAAHPVLLGCLGGCLQLKWLECALQSGSFHTLSHSRLPEKGPHSCVAFSLGFDTFNFVLAALT